MRLSRFRGCGRRRHGSAALAALALAASLAAAPAAGGAPGSAAPDSTLIVNATVIDGSGSPGARPDVRLRGDRIVAIGDLRPTENETVVDGLGLVLAPGFIDTHSHADAELFERPAARAAVSQGVTTVVVGVDGESRSPLRDFFRRLESSPAAVNVASWGGHNTYRSRVLGEDFRRPAGPAEIERMAALLREDLQAGALGLSTGLEYDPGIYSTTEEVVALAAVAAASGGRYASHLRSEDRAFWQAIDELLTIGRRARIPVHITHLKLAMQSSLGQSGRLLGKLDEARAAGIEVTADLYPYTYWQSTLEVLFPARDFDNPEAARFAVTEVSTPEGLLLSRFEPDPSLQGKTLAEIASLRGEEPATTLMNLIREARAYRSIRGVQEVESVLGVSMDEADIERLIRWPYVNVCTDGELWGSHPRGFGSFPRVLGRLVRERGVLSLPQAIHRMSGRAATTIGLFDRGRIETGGFADLVLFDPARVIDRATLEEPHAEATGISKVWVNGRLVWNGSQSTAERPGRVLRRAAREAEPRGRGRAGGRARAPAPKPASEAGSP